MEKLTLSELHVIRCLLTVSVMPGVQPLISQKLAMEEGYLGGVDLPAAKESLNRKIMYLIFEARDAASAEEEEDND